MIVLLKQGYDCTSHWYRTWVFRGLSRLPKAWDWLHLGTECTTWSVAACGKYRSRKWVLGKPFLRRKPKIWAKIVAANAAAQTIVDILRACRATSTFVCLENPQGFLLWFHPGIRQILDGIPGNGWYHINLCYCSYGSLWQKRTSLLTTCSALQTLASTCKHKRHRVKLSGAVWCPKEKRWRARTKIANEYPRGLLKRWCYGVNQAVRESC